MTPTRSLSLFLIASAFVVSFATQAKAADEGPGIETGKAEEAEAPPPAAAAAKSNKRTVSGAGVSAQDTLVGGQAAAAESTDEWKFNFKGFFRAPMRLGIGALNPGEATGFYAPPAVPDGNYTQWQYTNANPGPWVEMLFQYGNNRVMMTTAIASYNITSGGWRELQAQLGIDRAFLTLNFPEALGDRGGLSWNVGVFSNRYGAAGRYDAGAYETYLFGRTRTAGETLTANIWLNDDTTLVIEHGIGAKLDQQRWTMRAVGMPTAYESYEPYPGPAQQGTTLQHHAHVGINHNEMLTGTLHYVDTWTKDQRATMGGPDGRIRVIGADLKLVGGWMGDGYIGFSNTKAVNSVQVSDAIELLHSQGGWQLANNYFGGNGNGTMNTLLFQYQFSLGAFMTRPQNWWGDGADLVVKVFGMFNSISGTTDVPTNGSGTKKLKLGTDILYTPLPLVGFGGRVDLVQPDLDDATHSFTVLSPRLVFHSKFVTHEQIIVQYSNYMYKDNTVLPYPFGGLGAPFPASQGNKHVFTISASMWW